ncbi:class I SAM-dependent methyltransferase [Microlunatus sp. Y2014]|uniref:class I SAM-dependent methyltransferase n=1 Tax=Microlunatus sp. Y2014 TaxID=3418488 RepID=UPI003DA73603
MVRRLVGDEGAVALATAAAQPDVDSLAAATRLRRDHDPELAAAALQQVALRRRARTKFGDAADDLFLTADGLEQASRPVVSQWRAARFAERGVTRVVDLGCGIGADALAMARAGLDVVAVELDPATAEIARANLSPYGVEVVVGDAVELAADLLGPGVGVFCDPARRTERGRTWRVDTFRPPYDFVTGLLPGRVGCIKFGPGLPYELVPAGSDTTWLSVTGDVVEASVWSPAVGTPGQSGDRRAALLLPSGDEIVVRPEAPTVGPVGRFLIEPDGAVIRAGAVDTLAVRLAAHRLDPQIAYLTTDEPPDTPYGVGFEMVGSFPWKEKVLRAWVRDHEIGTLEIKKRGIEVDPATLRKRLHLKGSGSATIVITPSLEGARVLVVRRLEVPSRVV